MSGRELPSAPEAEISVLGSMILDHRVIPDVQLLGLTPESFASARHAAICAAIYAAAEGQPVDVTILATRLRSAGMLDEITVDDLVDLAESVPTACSAEYYARLVIDRHLARRLIDACGESIEAAYSSIVGQAPDTIDAAEARLFAVSDDARRSRTTGEPQDFAARLDQALADADRAAERPGVTPGIPTGWRDLDEMTCGLQAGEMIVVAARPSMGKTALALGLALNICSGTGAAVGLLSLEMSAQSIVERLVCSHAGVDMHRKRRGLIGSDEMLRLARACGELKSRQLVIDDTPGLTVTQARAIARRMASKGASAIIIDYLQLMSSPAQSRESRQAEVSAISRGIKALARELRVPVVVLSQLNRLAEQREGNRPRMSDLRESGAIEQDADVIILLHREEYYHQGEPAWRADNPDKIGVAELIVAKQRNGPTGTVELVWDAATTSFQDKAYTRGGATFAPPRPQFIANLPGV